MTEATVDRKSPVRLSAETMDLLRRGSADCAACRVILGAMDGDRLGKAKFANGKPYSIDAQRRHVLELKGLALSEETEALVKGKAGTCREPNGRGCFLCARILDAMQDDGILRDWPQDKTPEQGKFLVEAQIGHILLERGQGVEWEEVPA